MSPYLKVSSHGVGFCPTFEWFCGFSVSYICGGLLFVSGFETLFLHHMIFDTMLSIWFSLVVIKSKWPHTSRCSLYGGS